MLKLLFTTVLVLSVSYISAQNNTTVDTTMIDKAFEKVETESSFRGGEKAWIKFLQDNLVYPPKAVKKNIQGEVLLQFIVDKDGTVSDIEALSGPELLKKAAIEALKLTPRWIPARQGGRAVKSYKKQPIVFRLEKK